MKIIGTRIPHQELAIDQFCSIEATTAISARLREASNGGATS